MAITCSVWRQVLDTYITELYQRLYGARSGEQSGYSSRLRHQSTKPKRCQRRSCHTKPPAFSTGMGNAACSGAAHHLLVAQGHVADVSNNINKDGNLFVLGRSLEHDLELVALGHADLVVVAFAGVVLVFVVVRASLLTSSTSKFHRKGCLRPPLRFFSGHHAPVTSGDRAWGRS